MTLGRTSEGAIKIKYDPEGGGPLAVGCKCCDRCDYDTWQISVSQSLVGYGGFVCDEQAPSDTRYLQYNVSCDAGFTGNWCGGGADPIKNISVTTRIDPYTGLQCTQGLPPNGYTCSAGANCEEECSETSRTYTCDARAEDCAGKDENGDPITTIQTSYTLSEANDMAAVIGRATALLSAASFSELPGPNTSGEVKVGSGGEAVLAWGTASGDLRASRVTTRGVAQLPKAQVS
jgi:hypothetical protein